MKELNSVQMESVSGAGAFANAFGTVGTVFGSVAQLVGWKNAKANAGNMAKNAGLVIDSAIGTVTSFFKLVFRK
ncbi:hypothetical protein HGT71_13250 [Rosenbergiella epipactidis]|uniref:hypothetical protein n=1 Tax=Rosenbergiella epipactidis TaxID=1544694 RepID=UPI001BDAF40C|nr:hypothetical protein [Rosenbergiella epipactidis]MBT0719209.1 hypothetical protein [Rosenbergiella epipactidis]